MDEDEAIYLQHRIRRDLPEWSTLIGNETADGSWYVVIERHYRDGAKESWTFMDAVQYEKWRGSVRVGRGGSAHDV